MSVTNQLMSRNLSYSQGFGGQVRVDISNSLRSVTKAIVCVCICMCRYYFVCVLQLQQERKIKEIPKLNLLNFVFEFFKNVLGLQNF